MSKFVAFKADNMVNKVRVFEANLFNAKNHQQTRHEIQRSM